MAGPIIEDIAMAMGRELMEKYPSHTVGVARTKLGGNWCIECACFDPKYSYYAINVFNFGLVAIGQNTSHAFSSGYEDPNLMEKLFEFIDYCVTA